MPSTHGKSWVARVAQEQQKLYDVRHVTPEGKKAWFFLLVDPAKEPSFLQAVKASQGVDLQDFGEVVARGWNKPTTETRKMLEEKYGAMFDT